MNKLAGLGGLVVLAVGLGGCGSTVQIGALDGTSPSAAGALTSVPESAGAVPVTSTAGLDSSAGTAGSSSPLATGDSAISADAGSSSLPSTSGGSTASASLTPITVGFVVAAQSFDAAAKAAGVGALQTGDQKAQSQAVVNDINAHGGLAGRRINPVFVTPASSSSQDQTDQQTCDSLTQDSHVSFVVSTLAHSPTLLTCLAKRGVPLLDDGLSFDDSDIVKNYLYMPSTWTLDRLMRNEIDELARLGFLAGSAKVGVLTYDLPSQQRVIKSTVLPALAHYGKTNVVVAASPFTTEGFANQQSNVLKFRQAGVNRVILVAFNPIGFMTTAESQGYKPRYSLDSSIGPDTVRQTVNPDQLKDMVGVGWIPSYDTGSGAPVTAAGKRCLDLMKKAGQDTSNSSTAGLMGELCDVSWFLQAATHDAGAVSVSALAVGARLTRNFVSASSFATDMTTGRADGLSGYRDLQYGSSCKCIQYVGGIRPAA